MAELNGIATLANVRAEVHTLRRNHEDLAKAVTELRVESGKQSGQLDFLVAEAQERQHRERIAFEAQAQTGVELAKTTRERVSGRFKVAAAALGAVTALVSSLFTYLAMH